VEVVFGVGCVSIMAGVWCGARAVTDAHDAFHRALDEAKESIRQQAHAAKAVGCWGSMSRSSALITALWSSLRYGRALVHRRGGQNRFK